MNEREGFFIIDSELRLERMDEPTAGLLARLTQKPPERWLQQPLPETIAGFFDMALGQALRKAAAIQALQTCEIHDAGTASWHRFTVMPTGEGLAVAWHDITEEKRIALERDRQEASYALFFDSVDEGFFVIDVIFDAEDKPVDLLYVQSNAAARKMLGMDYSGKRLSEISPNYESYWFDIFGGVAKTGESVRMERFAEPDQRWYNFYVFRIGGPESRRIGNSFLDITDRVNAEAAIRDRESRQAFLLQFSDSLRPLAEPAEIRSAAARLLGARLGTSGIFFATMSLDDAWKGESIHPDADPAIVAGLRCFEDFGADYKARLLAGRTLVVADVHDDAKLPRASIAECDAQGIRSFAAIPLVKRGGAVALLVAALDHPHGWPAAEIAMIEEAASRIWSSVQLAQAEKTLRENERLFRTILEHSRDGINMLDLATGRYAYLSPSLLEMSGLMPTEASQITAEDALARVHPEDRAIARQLQERVAAGEDVDEAVEYRWLTDRGEYRWFSDRRRLVRGEDGRPVALVGLSRDITDRKLNEERLKVSEERAMALVDRLQMADQNKNRFLSVLSHELRNPLAAIMMSSALLSHVPPRNDQEARARSIIERQTAHLTRLVDDLLEVTRITENKIKLRKEPVELNELVQRAIVDYQPQLLAKGVDLVTLPFREPIAMDADPVRLTQAIGNILHNSVKFTSTGDRVVVSVEQDSGRRSAFIRIRDTGAGIEPALLQTLFEPFTQVERTLERSQGGLGLGLSIVKGIVALHGGEVIAESAGPGKGATFIIRLPLPSPRRNAGRHGRKSKSESNGQPATAESASAGQPADRPGAGAWGAPAAAEGALAVSGLRILVIEDNRDILDMLVSLLNLLGHETARASSGSEGITRALAWRPDVIISDIGLPDMSGFEIAQRIRRESGFEDMILIAISGYAQPEDLALAKAVGFSRHLAKPVALDALRAALDELQPQRKHPGG